MKLPHKILLIIGIILVLVAVLFMVSVKRSLTSFVDEQNAKNVELVPSPISLACNENVDCKLTEELYHPCGSVHSIHVGTPQSSIDAYNDAQMRLTEGTEYDCEFPPQIHEYMSMCQDHVCVSVKKQ